MRKRVVSATLVVFGMGAVFGMGLVAAGGVAFARGGETCGWNRTIPEGSLAMSEVVEHLTAAGYVSIQELEHEGSHFEAKARAADGRWLELRIDALTGAISEQVD